MGIVIKKFICWKKFVVKTVFFSKKFLDFDKNFSQIFYLFVSIIRSKLKCRSVKQRIELILRFWYHSLFTFISVAIEVSHIKKYYAFFPLLGLIVFCTVRIKLLHLHGNPTGIYSSSRLEVFYEKGVLRNFGKFTGKHLCQSLSFNKVSGLRPANLLKKRIWHRCFPVNFAKFLRTLSLTGHLRWLLLHLLLAQLMR